MPKNKKQAESSDSDSGPEDRGPAKKQKKSAEPEEENSWSLGKNRFIKLTEFKGKWYVNIREYYEANGELKPTKKGVMMTMEQWQKLKGFTEEIDEAIKKNV